MLSRQQIIRSSLFTLHFSLYLCGHKTNQSVHLHQVGVYPQESQRIQFYIRRSDIQFDQSDYSDADLLMLPGGMPGASNLFAHEGVREALKAQFAAGKKIAAICASPAVVLAPLGILDGKRATCYPGFEQALTKATYTGDLVTVDGNITTGEGPAAAFPYAYELLTQLVDKQTSDQIAEGMRFKHLMQR